MTWGEFKAAIEAQGVRDDAEIEWIDFDIDIPEATIAEKDGVQYVMIS